MYEHTYLVRGNDLVDERNQTILAERGRKQTPDGMVRDRRGVGRFPSRSVTLGLPGGACTGGSDNRLLTNIS